MEEGLINTTRATPRWVSRAVAAGEFIGLRPGHNTHRFYFVALVQFALSAAALWALSMGAIEADHCENYACSLRLILFQVIIMCVFQIDFLTFPYFARSTSNLWVAEGGKALESGHIGSVLRESLAAQPGGLVFFGVLVSGFLAPWLRGGWWWALIFGGVLMINCVTHLLANGLVADFIAIHLSRKQEDFQEGLLAGQFTYDQAVRSFNAINSERRQLQGVLSKTTTTFVFGVLLAEGLARLIAPDAAADLLFDAPSNAPDGMYVADQQLGWAPNPGFSGTLRSLGYSVPIQFNSLGHRGGEPAQPGGWLVVGDSFTLAAQVPEEETFTDRLRQAGIPAENAGVDGYSTWHARIRYARAADELQPDGVLLIYFLGNDPGDDERFAGGIHMLPALFVVSP